MVKVFALFLLSVNCWGAVTRELFHEYEIYCSLPSDIHEHIPRLRELASECSSAIEIGVNEVVSTWGILQGLSESGQKNLSYIGIDLKYPFLNTLFLANQLAESSGISFQFWQANDFYIDIEPTDLLFIDSWHTYCHLTYELEKFSPKVRKYIAMHDTGEPWGDQDEPCYLDALPDYPPHIDRFKQGLWPAIVDFLKTHPEWCLREHYVNNHGFTVLERKLPPLQVKHF